MNYVSFFNVIYSTNLILLVKTKSKNQIEQLKDPEINLAENDSSNENEYKLNYLTLLIWLLQLITVFWEVHTSMTNIIGYLNTNLDICFQENFCLPIVEMTISNLHPLCHLYYSVFYRIRQKLICYERAKKFFFDFQSSTTKPLSRNSIYLFGFLHILAFVETILKSVEKPIWKCCLEYSLQFGMISLYSMIMTFSYVVSRTYENINERINSFTTAGYANTVSVLKSNSGVLRRYINEDLLSTLEAEHWQIGNLSTDINDCYGLNLLFFWPYNIVQTITLLMNITDYMKQKSQPPGALSNIVRKLIRLVAFLLTIIYFSRIGTLITNEAERTKVCVEKLKLRYEDNMNNFNQRLIKQFKMKLHARKIQLTANDFLQINMRLIQSFFGLILTYWIVLIQFRSTS